MRKLRQVVYENKNGLAAVSIPAYLGKAEKEIGKIKSGRFLAFRPTFKSANLQDRIYHITQYNSLIPDNKGLLCSVLS